MNHLRIIIIQIFIVNIAKGGDWQWLMPSTSGSHSSMISADFDLNGNTYSCGIYKDSFKYDTITLANPGTNTYLAKHYSNGRVLIMKNMSSIFNRVKTDRSNNIYIAGKFNTTDNAFIGNQSLRDADTTKYILLAKLDSNLNKVWAIHYNRILSSQINIMDIFTDALDNVYLLVQGNNALIIAGTTHSAGATNGIIKINSLGVIQYYKQLPYALFKMAGIADASGNAYITGLSYGIAATLSLDGISSTNTQPLFSSTAYLDMFAMKLNNTGVADWVKLTNNAKRDSGSNFGPTGIALDSKDNVFIYGNYNNQAIFGTDTLNGLIVDQYSRNPFILKYGNDGSQKWAITTKQTTKSGMEFLQMKISNNFIYSLCRINNGGAYINNYKFPKLTGSGSSDRIIACFDSNMNHIWDRYLSGGETNNQFANIGIDNMSDLYVASGAQGTVKLGYIDTIMTPGIGNFVQYSTFIATSNPIYLDYAYLAKLSLSTNSIPTSNIVQFEQDELQIYPNPSSDFLYFESKFESNKSIDIYATNGSLVKHLVAEGKTTKIDVQDLQKGIYFMTISDNNSSVSKKLIVN